MPKLYFTDTGLVCSLLGIEKQAQLATHPMRGNLFETAIIVELLKSRWHHGLPSNLYFWRDKSGHEIDVLLDQAGTLIPLEIKAGETVTGDSFQNLEYWQRLSGLRKNRSFLIYAGDAMQKREKTTVLSWKKMFSLGF